jgi:hypothetical protein
VDPWLSAIIASGTTLIAASLAFYQWRRSERRQLDQLRITDDERILKHKNFQHSASAPFRARRAAALEELLARLTDLESIVRLAHLPDSDFSQRVYRAYSTLIAHRAVLTETEVADAQAYVTHLFGVHDLMVASNFSTTPFGEREVATNENLPELTAAAAHFEGLRTAHRGLSRSLREALGENPPHE